jgi:hypothetical protein
MIGLAACGLLFAVPVSTMRAQSLTRALTRFA